MLRGDAAPLSDEAGRAGEAVPVPVAAIEHVHDPSQAPEAYRIQVVAGHVTIASSTARGAAYGETTVQRLVDEHGGVCDTTIDDAPALAHRGIIEGFYGEPWSDDERVATFRLARAVKLNSYVYAPKDDPYHRVDWRKPYPADDLARIGRLASAAAAENVDFVFALHPAGSMRFSDPEEHELLADKARQLMTAGITRFALLFDDVPPEPVHEVDAEQYGPGGRGLGAAHAAAVVRFTDMLSAEGLPAPLVVPTDYAGTQRSDYREAFAAGLPTDVLVWWTGSDIVVGEVSRSDIDAAGDVFGDRLALWDNFPVNDFDRGRAFLGPLTGRTTRVAGSALRGAWTNPMVECAAGWFGIASFADWAWNPAAYDPDRSARAALALVAGDAAGALGPLVRTLSSWPPSAPMDAELAELARLALDAGSSPALRERLTELLAAADLDAHALARADEGADAFGAVLPVLALRPWAAAGAHMARAGLAALDLLEGGPDASADAVRDALERATAHPAKVAVDVVPAFVREVLARTAPAA